MKGGVRLPPFSAMAVLHAATSGQAHRGRRVTRGSSYPRQRARCSVDCVMWKKGRPLTASLLAQVEGLIAEARRCCVHEGPSCVRERPLIKRGTAVSSLQFERKMRGLRAEATPRTSDALCPGLDRVDARTKVAVLGRRAPRYAPWLALDTISAAAVHRGRRQRMLPTWLVEGGQGHFHH